ncbi:MAG: phosphatidate cytidylyltransferase [Halorhodospira sp.]
MLRTRVVTAAVLGPLLLGAIWLLPTAALALVLAGVAALAAWEWAGLVGLCDRRMQAGVVAVLLASLIPGWLVSGHDPGAQAALYAAAGLWLAVVIWLGLYARRGTPVPAGLGALGVGWLLLWPTWVALVYLHGQTPWGAFWVTFLLVLVWGADTGAYFAGRAWGRHRLAPRISPAKSWEGVLGGGVVAVLAGSLLVLLLAPEAPGPRFLLGLMVLVIIGSVVGDLFESMLKRQRAVKDSGGILPGHGGILDRIDSLTAAAPLLAAGLAWWQSGT